MAEDKRWKVGELAALAGVTVRTLHHYEGVGLLVPSERSNAGHRLYSVDDLSRLYRILALRRLGLTLDDVRSAMDGDLVDLRETVKRHLEQLEIELELQSKLRARLERLLTVLDGTERGTARHLVDVLEVMTMHERYYTPEQLAELERRRNELGDEGMRKAEQDWAGLIAAVEAEHAKGTDPADPRVQELVARWQDLISQFTGGDPAIRESLQNMYETEGTERASQGMVKPDVMDYMGRAMNAAK
ncbi:MAG: MerR family transcriptional regulator [Actinomycetota bacterium]